MQGNDPRISMEINLYVSDKQKMHLEISIYTGLENGGGLSLFSETVREVKTYKHSSYFNDVSRQLISSLTSLS